MYTRYAIQDSAYYSAYSEVLSGIVAHTYPFITADEIRQELAAAYEAGELAVDVSCCVESKFIAAAQWAIWDMISGQWGTDNYELSFNIDADTTSVNVTKHWADDEIGAEYIEVQLYADGVQYGEPVRLSGDNGWSYTWEELLKYSADGVAIEYEVKEVLVPGYYSSVTKDESGSKVITTLDSVSAFSEGATYVITYNASGAINALGDETGSGGSGLYWVRNLDTTDPGSIPASAMWVATGVSSDGSNAYLQNKASGNYLYYDGSYITLST